MTRYVNKTSAYKLLSRFFRYKNKEKHKVWDVPGYQIRAYLLAKKRLDAKRRKNKFHMKRVSANLVLADETIASKSLVPIHVVLNDFTLNGLYFFSSQPLFQGQKVAFTLTAPQSFYVKAEIVFCKQQSLNQSFFAEIYYPYRVGIRFEFQSQTEKTAVKSFWRDIFTRYLSLSVN